MKAGNYSITIPMQDMNKKIRVTQTVARRGESDKAEVTVKGVPAPKPSINEMDTDDTRVTGKGVPNSKVYVRIPGRVERHVDVDANGDWYLDTGLLNGGQEIIVHQELPRKLNSEEAKINVKQLPALRKSKYRSNEFSTRPYIWMGECMGNSKSTCSRCIYT